MHSFITLISVILVITYVKGQTCTKPTVTPSYYSSTDQKLSPHTIFVVEFALRCTNKVDNLQLYADVDGMQFPVTKSSEGDSYQISWTVKDKKTPSRSFDVRFFDEEGYNNLKKMIRSGQSSDSAQTLFSINVKHPGLSSGFWIRSELLALVAFMFVFYLVCQERSVIIA